MTQEIKNKLEQAAESARLPGKPWTVLTGDTKSAFILAAQTILTNPSEWGLITIEESNILFADNIDLMQSQLAKYREALEDVINNCEDGAVRVIRIAKEALKKEEQ